MSSENIHSGSSLQPSALQQQNNLIQSNILQLPSELLIRIFILSQNTALVKVCKRFYHISTSSFIRAQFLIQRYGRSQALGEISMKSFRMAFTLPVIDSLIKLRCSPLADGNYLVWRACEENNIRLFILLVDAIQPDTKTLQRYLRVAALKGSISILDLIVKRYGGIIKYSNNNNNNNRKILLSTSSITYTEEEKTIMTMACNANQVEMVKHLIQRYDCDPHVQQDIYLRKACLDGFEELVMVLLSGADIHAMNDTPLQNAVHRNHIAIVDLLLKNGADPLVNRYTCLIKSIKNQNPSILFLLLKCGADPRYQQNELFLLACREGNFEVFDLLLKMILFHTLPKPTAITTTAITLSSYEGWKNIFLNEFIHQLQQQQQLQQDYQPILNELVNCRKGKPLGEALKSGHFEIVKTLLELGANPNSICGIEGLNETILGNHLICVELMARHGAHSPYSLSHYLSKHTVKQPMKQLLQKTCSIFSTD
ncbi:ankyrin repeat-containing domain protein [Cunninghamella echinulata]|nr:ankyrin repeat-containing domain protein [Cunninghamella echinulata]